MGADLQEAILILANLKGADLSGANLQKAYLTKANLEASNFTDANLQGAFLYQAQFNEDTTLPDGSNWSPETTEAELSERFGVILEDPEIRFARQEAQEDDQDASE